MNKEQEEQVKKQIKMHDHRNYAANIPLTDNFTLESFWVMEDVFRPDIMMSKRFASWLYQQDIFEGKEVLDMGCGTGILGIVAGYKGAKKITFSDISEKAASNAALNLLSQGFADRYDTLSGDLFKSLWIPRRPLESFDVILFNHPFFDGTADEHHPIGKTMLGGHETLERFLEGAPECMNPDANIYQSYWDFAGKTNDPGVKGPLFGYNTEIVHKEYVTEGLQKGNFFIYKLSLDKPSPNL